jgi:hypothetical protein
VREIARAKDEAPAYPIFRLHLIAPANKVTHRIRISRNFMTAGA